MQLTDFAFSPKKAQARNSGSSNIGDQRFATLPARLPARSLQRGARALQLGEANPAVGGSEVRSRLTLGVGSRSSESFARHGGKAEKLKRQLLC